MCAHKVFVTSSSLWGIDRLVESGCDVVTWDAEKNGKLTKEGLLKSVVGASAIYCLPTTDFKIDGEVFDAAGPSLKVISSISVGVDHIDLEALKTRGVRLGYTQNDFGSNVVAELTIGLLLATARRIVEANQAIKDGRWKPPFWSLGGPLRGSTLNGSTVGIYGFGRIGQSVARKLKAFEVSTILYCSSSEKPEGKEIGAVHTTFEDLLKQSDFIVVNCALTDQTRGIFNAEKFGMMKPSAVFINTSRGGVVDHQALYDALVHGKIRAAGLDVVSPEPIPADHPLLHLKNCVITPHIGVACNKSEDVIGDLAVNNVISALTDSAGDFLVERNLWGRSLQVGGSATLPVKMAVSKVNPPTTNNTQLTEQCHFTTFCGSEP